MDSFETMTKAILFVWLIVTGVTSQIVPLTLVEPETISLSFTIRSFLPITCAPSAEIGNYWSGPPAIISREKGCPLKTERQEGTIIPHPDFQIGYEIWRNLTYPKSYYWAPGGGTPGLL